ncbi:hypothetical protein D9611_013561 [Ephemerocybe angulata]|uniref:Nudix hydrolase domain-containing protein n=1 Tax=Ephemerocybe angulata TaxID=980116 RepID=A0A8H5C367_9AGAR|nr:hypothetical protein D9611_013561 [Tulosesus angulatus]
MQPTRPVPSSSAIIDGKLYLGNLQSNLDGEHRASLGITHIVSVCPEGGPSTGPTHLVLDVKDNEYEDILGHLERGACTLHDWRVEERDGCCCVSDKNTRYGRDGSTGLYQISSVHSFINGSDGLLTERAGRKEIHPNYGFLKQLQIYVQCGYAFKPKDPTYRSWKRRYTHGVRQYLEYAEDVAIIVPDRLSIATDFPADGLQGRWMLQEFEITHLVVIGSEEVPSCATNLRLPVHRVDTSEPDIDIWTKKAVPSAARVIEQAIKGDGSVLVYSKHETKSLLVICAYLMAASRLSSREAMSVMEERLVLFDPCPTFFRQSEILDTLPLGEISSGDATQDSIKSDQGSSQKSRRQSFPTTRSSSLRTYAGDTSLPGGKVDPEDNSIEDTARREAFEEIGLPRDKLKVPLLCVLEPFLAAELIVIPVVVLILDKSLTPLLNQAEVDSLFSHPLASFLSTTPPFPSEPDTLEFEYHTFHDYDYAHSPGARKDKFRVHSFLTGREAGGVKPVFGLTAAMLIRTATIGYGREPSFEVHAPGSPSTEERIAWALLTRKVFVDACEKEGVDLTVARRIAGVDDQGSRVRLKEKRRKQVRSKL